MWYATTHDLRWKTGRQASTKPERTKNVLNGNELREIKQAPPCKKKLKKNQDTDKLSEIQEHEIKNGKGNELAKKKRDSVERSSNDGITQRS